MRHQPVEQINRIIEVGGGNQEAFTALRANLTQTQAGDAKKIADQAAKQRGGPG
jgi:hypothetical protein